LWLACHTQEEIAEAVGCDQPHVAEIIGNGKVADSNKPAATHLTDFEPPQIGQIGRFPNPQNLGIHPNPPC